MIISFSSPIILCTKTNELSNPAQFDIIQNTSFMKDYDCWKLSTTRHIITWGGSEEELSGSLQLVSLFLSAPCEWDLWPANSGPMVEEVGLCSVSFSLELQSPSLEPNSLTNQALLQVNGFVNTLSSYDPQGHVLHFENECCTSGRFVWVLTSAFTVFPDHSA